MEVLLIVSLSAKIEELKKLPNLLDDLIENNYLITFLNLKRGNQEIFKYLLKKGYSNYKVVGKKYNNWQIDKIFTYIRNYKFDKIIILGLNYNDILLKYLDYYIGSNTDLFVIVPRYGVLSDCSFLVNNGAFILCTIYDLKKYGC